MKKLRLLLPLLLIICLHDASAQNVLMEEHFNENENGWSLGENEWSVSAIKNGKLYLECKGYLKPAGGTAWLTAPDLLLPAAGFSVTCKTRWVKNRKTDGSFNPYGFVIGGYYFLAYADGNRRLLFYNTTEKKYEVIVDWGKSPFIRKDSENTFEIVYRDGKAAFYCNGEMLFKKSVPFTDPDKLRLRLYVENSEIVEFDDLIVKR
jgi:hypothetical protein